jgi:hypothetical protein
MSKKLTIEKFIEKARSVHGDVYDYADSVYVRALSKIEGDFIQAPGNHLAGHGCPKCWSNVSKMGTEWLDELHVPNDPQHREVLLKIGKRRFKADGFISSNNTVYEFYGDYFHGNPDIFDSTQNSGLGGKTYGELYTATIEREDIIRNQGYSIISIWENRWKKKQGASI